MKIDIVTEMGIRNVKIPFYLENEEGKEDTEVLTEYEYNILETVDIPGVSKVSKQIMDGKEYLLFPIYSYSSFKERLYKERLNTDLFCDFLSQLSQIYENMSGYLLDENLICLEPEYIFYDDLKKKYIFLPIMNKEKPPSKKFEQLFTFFADICPMEERELLEFIFENFDALSEEYFEPVSFMQYIVSYKFYKEKLYYATEEEGVKEDLDDDLEEELSTNSRLSGSFIVSVFLLLLAFCLCFLMKYQFKYSIVSIAATCIAVGLMAFQVLKITEHLPKRQNI